MSMAIHVYLSITTVMYCIMHYSKKLTEKCNDKYRPVSMTGCHLLNGLLHLVAILYSVADWYYIVNAVNILLHIWSMLTYTAQNRQLCGSGYGRQYWRSGGSETAGGGWRPAGSPAGGSGWRSSASGCGENYGFSAVSYQPAVSFNEKWQPASAQWRKSALSHQWLQWRGVTIWSALGGVAANPAAGCGSQPAQLQWRLRLARAVESLAAVEKMQQYLAWLQWLGREEAAMALCGYEGSYLNA